MSKEVCTEEEKKHQKIEQELRDANNYLKVIFEYAPEAYYLSDLKGNFVDGNKKAEEVCGYSKEELIGKNFLKLKLLPPKHIPKAAKLLAMNVMGKSTGPTELPLNKRDGKQIVVEIRTTPVKIKGKDLVLGIARDITQRKKMEEELRAKNNELERFNKILVGRELKMIELKKEIEKLKEKIKNKKK